MKKIILLLILCSFYPYSHAESITLKDLSLRCYKASRKILVVYPNIFSRTEEGENPARFSARSFRIASNLLEEGGDIQLVMRLLSEVYYVLLNDTYEKETVNWASNEAMDIREQLWQMENKSSLGRLDIYGPSRFLQ